jgi:hypothetical protein
VRSVRSIVILTGAGVSAESGVATIRDRDGIWAKVDYREVATPEGFAHDPAKVHAFYNTRRAAMAGVQPNAAHLALARLEREFRGAFLLVTQNIDDLHERAGSSKLIHMHGELAKALCARCGARREWRGDLSVGVRCETCGEVGGMRPDVVWFGEMPYRMDEIADALPQATCSSRSAPAAPSIRPPASSRTHAPPALARWSSTSSRRKGAACSMSGVTGRRRRWCQSSSRRCSRRGEPRGWASCNDQGTE